MSALVGSLLSRWIQFCARLGSPPSLPLPLLLGANSSRCVRRRGSRMYQTADVSDCSQNMVERGDE